MNRDSGRTQERECVRVYFSETGIMTGKVKEEGLQRSFRRPDRTHYTSDKVKKDWTDVQNYLVVREYILIFG